MSDNTVTVSRADLARAVASLLPIVPRRTKSPILANMAVVADGGRLTLTVTDLDMTASTTIDCDAASTIATTIDVHRVSAVLKGAPASDIVTVSASGIGATIYAGLAFNAASLPIGDFPIGDFPMPTDVAGGVAFNMPAPVLRDALQSVAMAISGEEARYYLRGVFTHRAGDDLVLVATDGHRLHKQAIHVDIPADTPAVIWPVAAVKILMRALSARKGPDVASIEISSKRVCVRLGDLVLRTKTIDGTYPAYDRVMPEDHNVWIDVDSAELSQALSVARVQNMTDSKSEMVRIAVDEVGVVTIAPGFGEGGVSVRNRRDHVFSAASTCVNARYMLDAIAAAGGVVSIGFPVMAGPLTVIGARVGWRGVVMGMRGPQ